MNEKTLRALEYDKIKAQLKDKAESLLAKDMVDKLYPIFNRDKVESLQRETEEALSLIIKRGNPPLYGINSVAYEKKRLEIGGALTPAGLIKISDLLRVSRGLKKYLKEAKDDKTPEHPVIESYISSLSIYRDIEEEINNAIINENEISDNASNNLRSIRRQITSKNDSIRDRLNSIITSESHKKYLQDNIVTMREGRYVIPVKQENRSSVKGLVHDVSSSGATVFVEPMAVVELNNQLRELEIKEREEIERILAELSAIVYEEIDGISANEDILKELDFIFAKGKLALEMNATKPIINENRYINIKKGRHPLLNPKEVVPIDIHVGDEFNSLIITGPNTGGKTVTLKTVGLLTLMSQSGLHIPADFNSQIGVFEQIFADIGDEQSIEQNLSTFSSHMTNIVDILNNVEDKGLVLFDELGAGTDPTEGAALAMSILDHLINKEIRTIATTHYSQLKVYALTTEGVRNASMEFDVESLSPTYNLLIGVPGKSNAFEISGRLGLNDYIIHYARDLISQENIEFEEVLQNIDKDRKAIEQEKLQSEKLNKEIKELKESLNKEKEKLNQMRDKIIQKANEEARKILMNAKYESDVILDELKTISSEIEIDKKKRLREAERMLKDEIGKVDSSISKDVLNVKSGKIPKNLQVGETVEVLSLNQKGQVLTQPDDKGNVEIQVGIMKVNVHISTLRRTVKQQEDMSKKSKVIMESKSRTIKTEIDLRGRNIEEAIYEIDKYLDDSYIAGLKEVYIIHGKGTGVLGEGIREYLKNHNLVKSYRYGNHNEGGSGVTAVEINK